MQAGRNRPGLLFFSSLGHVNKSTPGSRVQVPHHTILYPKDQTTTVCDNPSHESIPSLLHSGVPSFKPSPVHCRCYEWIKRGQHKKGPHYLTDSRVTRALYRANSIGSCSICYFRFFQFFANPILEMWLRVCGTAAFLQKRNSTQTYCSW